MFCGDVRGVGLSLFDGLRVFLSGFSDVFGNDFQMVLDFPWDFLADSSFSESGERGELIHQTTPTAHSPHQATIDTLTLEEVQE